MLSGKLPQRCIPLAPLLLVLEALLLLSRQLESRLHLLGFCLLLGFFRLGGRDRLFRRKPRLFSLVLVVVAADDDHDEDEHGQFGYGPERLDRLENFHGGLRPGCERLVVLGARGRIRQREERVLDRVRLEFHIGLPGVFLAAWIEFRGQPLVRRADAVV